MTFILQLIATVFLAGLPFTCAFVGARESLKEAESGKTIPWKKAKQRLGL